jgi:hypothetical protein
MMCCREQAKSVCSTWPLACTRLAAPPPHWRRATCRVQWAIYFSITVLYYSVYVSILIVYLIFVNNEILHVVRFTLQVYICTRFRLPSANGTYLLLDLRPKSFFPTRHFPISSSKKVDERDILVQFGIQVCGCVRNGNRYYLNHTHSVYHQLCGRRDESRTMKEVGNEVCEGSVCVLN